MPSNSKKSAAAVRKILSLLKNTYPKAACSLHFKTPHELLVATILSAQCTDERVNAVTLRLFKKYPCPGDFAGADIEKLENDVRSTGFFRNKAKAIKESSLIITQRYAGRMPDKLGELVKLPGVGRKTASVILGTAFGKAEGIVVDTHVARLAGRFGFTKEANPLKIERDLMALIPKNDWIVFSHLLIEHGRAFCRARRPNCLQCPIKNCCPSAKHFL